MWLGFKEEAAEVKEGFLEEEGLMMDHGAWAGSEEVKVASMTEVRDKNGHKQWWVGSDYEGLEHLS